MRLVGSIWSRRHLLVVLQEIELVLPVAVVLDLYLMLAYETAAFWIQVWIVELLDLLLHHRFLLGPCFLGLVLARGRIRLLEVHSHLL